MVVPLVVPRAQHTLSRRDIDPDALKVLYRLHHARYVAYLVGGSVRDLLLGRRPKDFDIGTDAHPYQVKKLFRNCWIIGRRFRLAHVKFGAKTIEVATFRRAVVPGTETEPPVVDADVARAEPSPLAGGSGRLPSAARGHDHLIHRDNTFGTPEEDAFRRDFTINALFYDIATFSVIDFVGGLEDLERRLIRCIGDPDVRFREDPVRMFRAIVLGARLEFSIDPPVLDAIGRHRAAIRLAAPARLFEEYYKVLRSGASARAFDELGKSGLLVHISPEIAHPLDQRLSRSLEALDRYRASFESAPETLTNPILLGSVLVPLGLVPRHTHRGAGGERPAAAALGILPLPRRDVERLDHVLSLQRRLQDLDASPRAKNNLVRRPVFRDALTWLEIHGDAPEAVAHWKASWTGLGRDARQNGGHAESGASVGRRRRRRRRGPRSTV